MALYFLLFATFKNKDSLAVLLAFVLSVLYTSSSMFDSNPSYVNHLIVSICFVPSFWFLSKPVFFAVLLYSLYHWFVAFDYIYYPNTVTFLSGNFYLTAIAINGLIMAVLFYVRRKGNYIRITGMGRGWLPDILHRVFDNKKGEKV